MSKYLELRTSVTTLGATRDEVPNNMAVTTSLASQTPGWGERSLANFAGAKGMLRDINKRSRIIGTIMSLNLVSFLTAAFGFQYLVFIFQWLLVVVVLQSIGRRFLFRRL